MEVQESASVTYPRWVMLEWCCRKKVDVMGDVRTQATAFTTAGYPIHVSLRLADPPAASCVCIHLQLPVGVYEEYSAVLAAHGDSVLIQVSLIHDDEYEHATCDLFVYNAGDAPRPPSLSLLPPCCITTGSQTQNRKLLSYATGLIYRGDDDLVVAELTLNKSNTTGLMTPELVLFRSGEWIVKRPRIIHGGGHEFGELPEWWTTTDTVVPIGDRQLCWVSLTTGVLICDVFEEIPRLQYVELPDDPGYGEPDKNRNVCTTAGGSELKFVNIFPRCCCGVPGSTGCRHTNGAYVIHTWTLRMSDMKWVKDGMVDATELWALDAYKGLPRVQLNYPVVSIDEPYVICFVLIKVKMVWMLMVDTRSKTIRSVSRRDPGDRWDTSGAALIASNVSYYFNSKQDQRQVDMERSLLQVREDNYDDSKASDSILQSSCETKLSVEPAVQALEILAALQEIPSYGLDGADMLKAAYRVLSHGDGRRFRSLLSLPKDLRKHWLLMEIKASELA